MLSVLKRARMRFNWYSGRYYLSIGDVYCKYSRFAQFAIETESKGRAYSRGYSGI